MLSALVALAAAPSALTAQEPRVTLLAGVSEFDLSGTGTAFTAGARIEGPIRPALLLEGGMNVMFADQQFGDTTTVLLPEAQVQLQLPRRLAPYVGLGIGLAIDLRDEAFGGMQTDPTFSGSVGLRFDVTERVGARVEMRVRGHDTGFVGSTADWTGGLSWRF